MAIKKGKIITVTSMKGGTGKTTTTLNLAGIYKTMGKKVLLIDLDLYGSAIAASLNLVGDKDIYKLVNDLSTNHFDYIENYTLNYEENIDVLPAPKDPRDAMKVTSKYIETVLNKASTKYDIILIDTNYLMDEVKLVTLDNSDQVVYVMINDPIDIKNMKSIVSIYKDLERNNYKIVLNESIEHNRSYFSRYDIKNVIHDNVDYTIPANFHIQTIDKYVLDGRILTLNKKIVLKHKKAMKNFELLAKSLIREEKKK